jgi:hypothetical protein
LAAVRHACAPDCLGVRKGHDRVRKIGPIATKANAGVTDGSDLKLAEHYFSNIITLACLFAPCCKT